MTTDMFLPLLTLVILSLPLPTNANDNNMSDIWATWSGLIQPLLGLFFVILGLHLLLYSHFATHDLMKRYLRSPVIPGQVLSCEEQYLQQYEISVLYTAMVRQYEDDPRNRFRYPTAKIEKSFLRRFRVSERVERGETVELFLLPETGRSGLLKQIVDETYQNHSHFRSVLILVPGGALLSLLQWLALVRVRAMESMTAWIVFGITLFVILLGSQLYTSSRWLTECQRRFFSAVPVKNTNNNNRNNNSKQEPLLMA